MELTLPIDYRETVCAHCGRWTELEYTYTEWSERRGSWVHRRTAAAPCTHPVPDWGEDYEGAE